MRKLFSIMAIATPIVLTGGTVGIYLAVATYKSHNKSESVQGGDGSENLGITNSPKSDSFSKFKIFPDIDQHDFYNNIRINKLKAVIDEEMQAKIINYVFRHTAFTEGDLSYSISKLNDQDFQFHFQWVSPDGNPHYKTYHFVISDTLKKSV